MNKRVFDLVFLVLTFPVWFALAVATAVLTALFIGWPILYFDDRAGLHGRPFRLVKFRTMREGPGSDAERLTRTGRILRALSLDELAEIWNVVRGEMSLVGPRPLPVRYLPRYTAEQNRRHEVLPGLTGLAQVMGRNALTWEEKFAFDLQYVDRHTIGLDLKIIALTFLRVIAPRGISHPGEATMHEFKGGAA